MILTDVNVLLYAHREDANDHKAYREWLEQVINGPSSYAMSDMVLSAVLRIATHPRIFDPPSPLQEALSFCNQLRDQPHCVSVAPGPRRPTRRPP